MSWESEVCVTCGCDGAGTTAERGCACDTCHAQPGQFLGGLAGTTAEANDFARDVGAEWRTRVALRHKGRTIRGLHMWDIFVPEVTGARR